MFPAIGVLLHRLKKKVQNHFKSPILPVCPPHPPHLDPLKILLENQLTINWPKAFGTQRRITNMSDRWIF